MHQRPDDASSTTPDDDAAPAPGFRLGFVPGVNPAKWIGVWRERRPEPLDLVPVAVLDDGAAVRAGNVDAALIRLPVNRDGLDAIPLYEEVPVVVVPTDHVIAAFDEVAVEELADEVVLHPLDDLLTWDEFPGQRARERPTTTADAVALVAAGIGVLVVPMSLARLHHRKDLTFRPLVDGPTSGIALAWQQYEASELIEEFIGIVRGRTANSSRGQRPQEQQADAQQAKPAAKQGERAGQPGRGRGNRAGTKTGLPPRNPGRKPKPGKAGRKGKGKGSR